MEAVCLMRESRTSPPAYEARRLGESRQEQPQPQPGRSPERDQHTRTLDRVRTPEEPVRLAGVVLDSGVGEIECTVDVENQAAIEQTDVPSSDGGAGVAKVDVPPDSPQRLQAADRELKDLGSTSALRVDLHFHAVSMRADAHRR